MIELRDAYVLTNGVALHVVQAGPEDGPLVLLLHGFPEFWYGWHEHIEALANAGLRVWVPDQRGYNLSDKPTGVGAYQLDTLARDITGLIDAAGCERAYIAGHDWGANVAWWLGMRYPDRVAKLVTLNVAHPAVMQRALRHNSQQMRKSWYIFFFQLPWLPEMMMQRDNYAFGVRSLKGSSLPGTFSAEAINSYREAWKQQGALTGMINWYRAIVQRQPASGNARITPPTMLIWGKLDRFLGSEMAQPSIDLCDRGRLVFFDDATHWVQHEKAAEVSQLLLDFFHE